MVTSIFSISLYDFKRPLAQSCYKSGWCGKELIGKFVLHVSFSWYFGPLSREETNEIFDKVRSNGVFLVRESQSIKGDFVLCVR